MYGYGRPTVVSNIVVSKCECISLAKTVTHMYGYVMCAISMENNVGDQRVFFLYTMCRHARI